MRLKKVKGASEKIDKSPYILKEPITLKGKYNDLFNNDNPIKVEIGMGKGDFIIENAIRYPNINFIGIEKFDSVMVRAVEKLEDIKLDNLKLIKIDALLIDTIFNKEIDTIYLNFSDPWPKKRHQDRRLTSPIFLEKYNNIFKSNKNIIMKTDNRKLFEYSVRSFNNNDYLINDISLDLYSDDISDNIPTEYETKFVAKGMKIYKIDVTKE
ncbi:MAG: tRNA (guanosine(46)-N7)-methyltransferase TrmB [Bacilli bacterium]|nr:tRNA (guanosine(46)-N7)-methyltransferase TrmB [Bacilli bacterium]